jgi:hypothetical protein
MQFIECHTPIIPFGWCIHECRAAYSFIWPVHLIECRANPLSDMRFAGRARCMLSCLQCNDLDYGYIILHTTKAPIWFVQDPSEDFKFSMIFMTTKSI